MRKRQWMLLAVSCLTLILIVASILKKPDADRNNEDIQDYETEVQSGNAIEKETAFDEKPENKSGQEEVQNAEEEPVQFDLKAISSFMEKGKIQELKKKILRIMPEGAKRVSCLDYQKASAEEMSVTCYLLFDTGQIAEVFYSFSQGTVEVKMSALKEADIKTMEESEHIEIEESEKKAKEEAEKRLEKARRKEEKRKAKETEQETRGEVSE